MEEINNLFSRAIFLLLILLIVFIIKTVKNTIKLKKIGNKSFLELQYNLEKETLLFKKIKENILLADDLNKSIFNRLSQITSDLLLVQKLIFESRIN